MSNLTNILSKKEFSQNDLEYMLGCSSDEAQVLYSAANQTRIRHSGNKVYMRGLIEISNICSKNCFYCGIRKGNTHVTRYQLSEDEVLAATQIAVNHQLGSVVIQGGELSSPQWTSFIEKLILKIRKQSQQKLGITLSLGEQTEETYQKWFNAGAHRYLLRIESSNQNLYSAIHPSDNHHSFSKRVECLSLLKKIGFQTDTGVMIGLPGQNLAMLAEDLRTMQDLDIDMCGMGPYIEHHETPLYSSKEQLIPVRERFDLSLRMVAILRLMMKDINIAATTAMETITTQGRIMAFQAGANIVMPNITPQVYLPHYLLYDNKTGTSNPTETTLEKIISEIQLAGYEPGMSEWGDSVHYKNRQK